VLAGPASVGSGGMGGGPGGGAFTRGSGGPPSGGAMPARGGGSLSASAIAWLEAHQGSAKYLLAAVGSQTTASIIIQTGEPVVTIGGFNGQDPAPTVSRLARMVADGELKYVLLSDGGGPGGGSSSSAISSWVKAHGTAVSGVSVGSGTLYAVSA
jgi:4-amino-4-deoxy-L-arabinose transferase-like glycosyltransferase